MLCYVMTVETVGGDARINRWFVLTSRQLSNSPPQLLCVVLAVGLFQLTFAATRDVPTYLPC